MSALSSLCGAAAPEVRVETRGHALRGVSSLDFPGGAQSSPGPSGARSGILNGTGWKRGTRQRKPTVLDAPRPVEKPKSRDCLTSSAAINFTADMCRVSGGLPQSQWPVDLDRWAADTLRRDEQRTAALKAAAERRAAKNAKRRAGA